MAVFLCRLYIPVRSFFCKCAVNECELYSAEEGGRQHPCPGVAPHPLRLVPGHRQRSLLRGRPARLGKLVGCLLQQVLRGEGIGRHLQRLHRQKLVIPQHPSSPTEQEKVVFLSLQGELQVKVKIKCIKMICFSSFGYKVLRPFLAAHSPFKYAVAG